MKIKKVAILGAGTMGSQIAAHIANAGFEVLLLDVSKELARNGLRKALEINPPAFMDKDFKYYINIGSFEEDFEKIREYDWIIEAVVENVEVKRKIFEKVEKYRKNDSIVSSNTSGIPIKLLAEDRSEEFRSYFLGTHFFNPPRYMKLLEIIPTEWTKSEVIEEIKLFCEDYLGKGIVFAKDTPNFIANRIGIFSIMTIFKLTKEMDLSVEEVDYLTGELIGRPRTATYRLADLVGIDVLYNVATNLKNLLKEDEFKEIFEIPNFLEFMIKNNLLGDKTKGGFYKKEGDKRFVLDINTLEYREQKVVNLPEFLQIQNIESVEERIRTIFKLDSKYAEFLKKLLTSIFVYSINRVGEISDDIVNIDNAMKWGFNWKIGPFETIDVIGKEKLLELSKKYGYSLNRSIPERFYIENKYYDFLKDNYEVISRRKEIIVISELKKRGDVILENADASLIDLKDGVLLLEFHSKANTIGIGTISMLNTSLDILEKEKSYNGLVITNDDERNFSAGANLGLIAMSIGESAYDEIERAVINFQKLNMRMKYFKKPIVAGAFGIAVGGGCEILLHTHKIVAHAELYTGLVEIGVGLIPAGGGTKELTIRALSHPENLENYDELPILRFYLENIATAKVSTSAYEAKKMGIIREGDIIIANRDFMTYYAKNLVIGLYNSGFRGFRPKKVRVLGWDGYSAVLASLVNLKTGKFITEYDAFIIEKLAYVMTGGPDIAPNTLVDEWQILEWERKAFLELVKQPRTQERIFYFLKNRKPLRN
ncbi:MAG: 3-hydroxyacyl-CoA dehydrogenase NAD-binding domain-containing protein [candidate division WOR-3 bacterium]|nr:3-hydroxyacyl-CoA dehydrogenase NAD-binding domain-containing protein [candidate division WOR-3 bacterium]MCX7947800.1 3-hydroxyacyl-CoA dehydrogenase NAD-binding domain-containing protein [candidate division WOR-3 bacterium]MDW8150757.1 3-hydroxyacyl-CoA dehydrogenase NAD-binding domain-containing protein [candidate division WOR-3 bacterium]